MVNVENLVGSSGNDSVTMTGAQLNGFSSINLGGGNDTLNITSTSTGLNALSDSALSGVEVISAADATSGVTINLSNQTEGFTIIGSNYTDTITGGHGDDVIYGGGNNDVLSGGDGDDLIYRRHGNNTISGGAGNDAIYGGSGNNTISGGDGNDLIIGGSGTDTLYGDAGDDIIYGGSGADTIYGGDGNDLIIGGSGAEKIDGGAGNDIILGTSGNDIITGGLGSDTLSGGSGADKFVYLSAAESPNSGSPDTITDFTHGSDKIDFTSLAISGSGGTLFWSGTMRRDPWRLGDAYRFRLRRRHQYLCGHDRRPDARFAYRAERQRPDRPVRFPRRRCGGHEPCTGCGSRCRIGEGRHHTSQPNPVNGNVLSNDTDVDAGIPIASPRSMALPPKSASMWPAPTARCTSMPTAATPIRSTTRKASVQALAEGQQVTDVFSYTNSDNHGGSSSANLTITVTGTNDAAVLSADTRNLTETNSAADISTSGTLTISDVDSPATFVAQAGTAGSYGTFAIGTDGAWTYTASSAHNEFVAGTTYTDTFDVASADGTHTSVTVNILGTNDAAVLSADTRNLTETNSATDISTSGTLTISDVDSPATFVAQAGTAGSYGTFAIGTDGAWTYTASSAHNEFVAGTTYTDTFDVASADGTHTSVTVNILGTNDAAVLSADTRNLTETNSAADISTSGTLTISDVDSPATFVAQAGTAGSYGTFAIGTAGAWTYTASSAHNEFVAGTTYTDTFDVVSADGTHTSVTVNILGTNDAAVLSADTRNLTETNSAADISTSGTLTISDVDSPATFVAQAATAGSYGTFAIGTDGAWTYTASSAHNEFVAGTTYTDTFDVASADGTHTSVTVNILGTNDAAVLSADTRNLTETNSAADISTSGTLTISDVDSPATFVAQAATAGSYGTFAIDTAGAWTYTASSAHNEFVAGTTYTDTFDVASADGTHTSVTVNILGTNDAAVLSADTRNLTETNSAADISTSGTLTISDVDSPATFVAQAATAGSYGTFAIDTAGAWTYTASSAHNEFVGRHHLYRHLRRGERRRHPHLGHHQHPRHQRRRGSARPTPAT